MSICELFNADHKRAYSALWQELVRLEEKNWRWVTVKATVGILLLLVAAGLQVIDVRRAQKEERSAQPAPVSGLALQLAAGAGANPRGRR